MSTESHKWTQEDCERHKRIREEEQANRQSPDDYDDLVTHSQFLESLRKDRAKKKDVKK